MAPALNPILSQRHLQASSPNFNSHRRQRQTPHWALRKLRKTKHLDNLRWDSFIIAGFFCSFGVQGGQNYAIALPPPPKSIATPEELGKEEVTQLLLAVGRQR